MRNLVTRTIKSYVTPVTLLTVDKQGKIVESEALDKHVSFTKVAQSTIIKKVAENTELKEGQSIVVGATLVEEKTLGMPTEYFVANAKPLEFYKDDKENEVEEEQEVK